MDMIYIVEVLMFSLVLGLILWARFDAESQYEAEINETIESADYDAEFIIFYR